MAIARSKLTRQGQISVPVEIRRRLGLDPGAVLEWDESGGEIVVRKSGRYSSAEIHAAVFADDVVNRRSPEEIEEGIRRHVRKRHARG